MKSKYFLLMVAFTISCLSNRKVEPKSNLNFHKYELAYNSLTKKENMVQPFLEEFQSDASGVKLIPKIFIVRKYSIYGSEHFKIRNSYGNNEFSILSKKYSNHKWRKDKDYRVLIPDEVKNFHGPLKYIYFSEIKNDSLRADVLNNPYLEYSMTTCERYLIIFKNESIKSVQKTVSHYD